MLTYLELINYKRHRHLEISFTEGLNVIRAANESGKSTIYEAIAYALGGARTLPESLEETATWGCPTSSLKVKLKFTHAGADYQIIRSKSGAELSGPGVVSSGHSEVTAFVERLFGTTYKVWYATLIASQGDLQKGLDGSSISLIEKLSKMDIIDEYVKKVLETLPSGNTKALEELVNAEPPEAPNADFSVAEASLSIAQQNLAGICTELDYIQSELMGRADAHQAYKAKRQRIQTAESVLEATKQQLAGLKLAEQAPVKPAVTPGLKESIAAEKQNVATAFAFSKWQGLQKPAAIDGITTVAELSAAIAAAEKKALAEQASYQRLLVQQATLKATMITQTACGLCGKDLSNVPEVVATNTRIQSELDLLSDVLKATGVSYQTAKILTETLKSARFANAQALQAVQQYAAFVKVDSTKFPYQDAWAGPSVQSPAGNLVQMEKQLAAEDAAMQTHNRALASYTSAVKLREDLQAKADAVVVETITQEDTLLIQTIAGLLESSRELAEPKTEAVAAVAEAQSVLNTQKAVFDTQLKAFTEAQARLEKAKDLLLTMNFNNGIVKKLREVRPVVARELWNMVLSGVSQVFTHIRGTPSVVTRGEDKFLIDGKGSSCYSGSTKDALGLATRVMLQKTFLGSLDFILLDEPAAAADTEREDNMLAAIARVEYKQVILVTHSDRADTFATQMITI